MSGVNLRIPSPEPRSKRWLLVVPLALVIGGYVAAMAYMKLNERAFVYQPGTYGGRAMVEPAADLRVDATRVRGADSLALVTWLIPPRDSITRQRACASSTLWPRPS